MIIKKKKNINKNKKYVFKFNKRYKFVYFV